MSQQLKTKLIWQCMDTVGLDLDGRRPLNIAVIGPPGCGKSSFLNTIFASFNYNDGACWREIAKMGDYGKDDIQETSRLRMYPKRAYMEMNHFALMPTFLDITGLEDEASEINKEMLSMLFNGKIKERENLSSVHQCYNNNGQNIQKLRQLYNKRPVTARVDRIIVVCTANDFVPLPVSLLRAIRETAMRGSRDIPVYGVLTHADKQRLNERLYMYRQTRFRNLLGLIDTRFKCIVNYCTAADATRSYISRTIPELDIPVLELMTQVLYHHPDDTIVPDDTITPDEPISWKKIALATIIILLGILLMKIYSITNFEFRI